MVKNKEKPETWIDDKLTKKAARDKAKLVFQRLEEQQPQCFWGSTGICCKNCNMGPCRIIPGKASRGICGATANIIAARNLLRTAAAGACCHVEHARENVLTLWKVATNRTKAYRIENKEKLRTIARKLKINARRPLNKIAELVSLEAFEDFRRQHGLFHKSEGNYLNWLKINAPRYLQKLWNDLGILPENADIETSRALHATTMGNEASVKSLLFQALKLGLVDGYAGMRMATDMQDILFGSPRLVKTEANLGTLKSQYVNIAIHGHIPLLSKKILEWAKKLEGEAKKQGAKGINIVGVCCTGHEMTERHGIALAAHVLQAEMVLVTGAVEAMVVDAQCIYPSLAQVASCYHTKLITTIAEIPGAIHLPFKIEKADKVAKQIVKIAINNYKNRNRAKIFIPNKKTELLSGFSVEQIIQMLSKLNEKEPLEVLIENIKNNNIRGIAAIIGCRNPKLRGKKFAENLIKNLLKENVLVVTTGCIAHGAAQEGLMKPEAIKFCGERLKNVLLAIGKANGLEALPPVLHMGSCVDNSRIIELITEISNYVKKPISKLPVVASAPELVTEKATAIAINALAHGIAVHVNPPLWITNAPQIIKTLTKDLEKITGGKLIHAANIEEATSLLLKELKNKKL